MIEQMFAPSDTLKDVDGTTPFRLHQSPTRTARKPPDAHRSQRTSTPAPDPASICWWPADGAPDRVRAITAELWPTLDARTRWWFGVAPVDTFTQIPRFMNVVRQMQVRDNWYLLAFETKRIPRFNIVDADESVLSALNQEAA